MDATVALGAFQVFQDPVWTIEAAAVACAKFFLQKRITTVAAGGSPEGPPPRHWINPPWQLREITTALADAFADDEAFWQSLAALPLQPHSARTWAHNSAYGGLGATDHHLFLVFMFQRLVWHAAVDPDSTRYTELAGAITHMCQLTTVRSRHDRGTGDEMPHAILKQLEECLRVLPAEWTAVWVDEEEVQAAACTEAIAATSSDDDGVRVTAVVTAEDREQLARDNATVL
jgi:hypothetical protein